MPDERVQTWERYLADKKIDQGCCACEHYFSNEEIGDYGQVYSSEPECGKHRTYANLPTFPFQKIMPCFALDFWYTPFPDVFRDSEFSDVSIAKVYRQFYVPWRDRGAHVEELSLWEAEHTKGA